MGSTRRLPNRMPRVRPQFLSTSAAIAGIAKISRQSVTAPRIRSSLYTAAQGVIRGLKLYLIASGASEHLANPVNNSSRA
ncbi:hypothetical protein MRS44_017683 [Fusarium solani]|uniref:uncharacterized protein n=1 Tax=Fusarium solani TaxID=169388 RepID=UPI0032C49032|nr:hypothetical protein MRS44_017683 [Fusarium solani]